MAGSRLNAFTALGLILFSALNNKSSLGQGPIGNMKAAQKLLEDNVPPNWYHIRAIVLVSIEAYQSYIFRNDTKQTISMVGATFNYVNAIWSQVNVSVYVTEIIIWQNLTGDGTERLPEEDWNAVNKTRLINKLEKAVRNKIWRNRTNADLIVVIRNLETKKPNDTDAGSLAISRSMCRNPMLGGALVVVRTKFDESPAQPQIRLASRISGGIASVLGVSKNDDDMHCTCKDPSGQCIMNNDVRTPHWFWSNCSLAEIKKSLNELPPLCLKQVVQLSNRVNSPRRCGNGILEPGEDCDCGPEIVQGVVPDEFATLFCSNPSCCNASTCKLREGARCASGSCCNANSCSFSDSSKICRPKRSQSCDFTEFCSGSAAICPDDRYLMSGLPCSDVTGSEASCYEGRCVNRNQHCQLVMGGSHLAMADTSQCYLKNFQNLSDISNCGHDWFQVNSSNNSYKECANEEDAECGNIWCNSYSRKALDRNRHYDFRSAPIGQGNTTLNCYGIAGQTLPDYGHTPDGVLCANGTGYCYKQKCMKTLPKCNDNKKPCDNFGEFVYLDGTTTSQSTQASTMTKTIVPSSTLLIASSTLSQIAGSSVSFPEETTLQTMTKPAVSSSTLPTAISTVAISVIPEKTTLHQAQTSFSTGKITTQAIDVVSTTTTPRNFTTNETMTPTLPTGTNEEISAGRAPLIAFKALTFVAISITIFV